MEVGEYHDGDSTPPRALSLGRWQKAVLRSVGLEIPGGSPAPSVARHRVLDALAEVLRPEEQTNLALLISELVTNAVRHAGMGMESDVIKVHAAVTPERTRIEVCDQGRGFSPGKPRVRSFEAGGGGLGLVLLDRLSAKWGVATDEDVCVWAEFDRPVGMPA
jgi:anti-sigma regulatory factor (Ser/Thr protein kinase)